MFRGNVDPLIRFLKAYDIGEDAIWFEVFQLTVKQPISEKELLYVDDRLEYFRKEPYCLEDNVDGFLSALTMKDISLKVSSKQPTSYSHSNASTGKKTSSDVNGSSVAMSAGANSDTFARKQRSKNCGRHYNPPHGPGAQESAKMEKSTETGDRFSGVVVNISVYSTSGLLEPPDAVLESPYTKF